MNTEVQTVSTQGLFKRAGIKETAVLLAAAWLIPFLVHVLPWSGTRPLGAHLLPMFWAAFVAVYFYGLRMGLLVGLFAPALNLVVTGLPALRWLSVLGFELVVFSLFVWWTVRKTPRLWLIAPLGYVAAKTLSTLLQFTMNPFGDIGIPSRFFIESLANGLPGLAVLAVVNFGLIYLYPKSGDTEHDDAAGV